MENTLWQVLLRASLAQAPLSCDDCYILIDYLSDLLAEGISPGVVFALADKYLKLCPNCEEEHRQEFYELLLLPEAGQNAPPPATAVARG